MKLLFFFFCLYPFMPHIEKQMIKYYDDRIVVILSVYLK